MVDDVQDFSDVIMQTETEGGKVLILGCGGSAATAEHFASELCERGIPAFTPALPIVTAFANNFGKDRMYAAWIAAVSRRRDLVIGICGGKVNQPVAETIYEAVTLGLEAVLMVGNENQSIAEIQRDHLDLVHAIADELERRGYVCKNHSGDRHQS